jgi:hypothetical protein
MAKPKLPRDANHNAVPLVPSTPANAVTVSASNATAVTLALNANTTLIEVNALAQGVFMRYGGTAVTTSAFDEYILANSVRHYVIPNGVTQVSFIEQTAGSTIVVIEK